MQKTYNLPQQVTQLICNAVAKIHREGIVFWGGMFVQKNFAFF